MIIYIAGPITGKFEYRKQFRKRERLLRAKGHIVLNPATLPAGLKDYMPTCKAMIDQAESVLFMDGWMESIGAKEEHQYALDKKKRIIYESNSEVSEAEYWRMEALKATAQLGEMKIKIAEAARKLDYDGGKQ